MLTCRGESLTEEERGKQSHNLTAESKDAILVGWLKHTDYLSSFLICSMYAYLFLYASTPLSVNTRLGVSSTAAYRFPHSNI